MTAPQTTKAWSISPNNRMAYPGALVDLVGWWAYANKTQLLTVCDLKWSCDGTTGPVDALDNTDRITSGADFVTRATIAAAAQSWFVVENPEGAQLLIAFQGASDSIARVSFSPRGLFTLAGTTTHQPTASDEVIISAATTIVGTSTSADRVMSIWVADDGTGWRCPVFASSAIQSCLTFEKVTRIAPATTFTHPYIGSNFVDMSRNQPEAGGTPVNMYHGLALGAANRRGYCGSVFTAGATRDIRMVGTPALGSTSDNTTSNGASFPLVGIGSPSLSVSTYCASMGGTGALTWPIHLWGEYTANCDGPWGTLIDWHQVMTTSLTNPGATESMPGYEVGDVPGVSGGQTGVGDARTNWWVALGAGALWPWKNAAASMEIV